MRAGVAGAQWMLERSEMVFNEQKRRPEEDSQLLAVVIGCLPFSNEISFPLIMIVSCDSCQYLNIIFWYPISLL